MKPYHLFFLLLSAAGCRSAQPASPINPEANPEILSVILRLSGTEKAPLIETVEVLVGPGRLKSPVSAGGEEPVRPGDLQCSFLDRRRQLLQQVAVADPRRQELEYGETDGTFRRITRTDTVAVFSLRVPWQPDIQFLKIEEWREGKKKRLLTILSLHPDRL